MPITMTELGRKQLIACFAASGVITVVAIVLAADRGNAALSAAAAGMFTLTACWVALRLNAAQLAPTPADRRRRLASTNSGLLAAAFAWGGAAILAGYYLTELFWHHAWQYGLAMALIAMALGWYCRRFRDDGSALASPLMLKAAAYLSALNGLAALIGVALLIASGKLTSGKSDWLANHVFVAGGIVVVLISFLAARAQLSGPPRRR